MFNLYINLYLCVKINLHNKNKFLNYRHSRISRGRNQLRGPFGELLMEEMAKSGSRSSLSKSSPSSSLLPSSPTFPLLSSSSPTPTPGTYPSSIISSLLAPLNNYNVSIFSNSEIHETS